MQKHPIVSHIFKVGLVGILISSCFGCSSLPSGAIPRRTIFGAYYEKDHPRLSPDGTKLAYIEGKDGIAVMIRDLKTGHETQLNVWKLKAKNSIPNFFWHPDSRHLLFWHDFKGDENDHLAQIDIETSEALDLTPFEGSRASQFYVEPRNAEKMFVEINDRDKKLFDLYEINSKSGQVSLLAGNPGNVTSWIIDHNMNLRGVVSRFDDGDRILLWNGKWTEFRGWPSKAFIDAYVGISKDNDKIWVISSYHSNTGQLWEINLNNKDKKVIASDPNYDISYVQMNAARDEIEMVAWEKEKLDFKIFNSQKSHYAKIMKSFGTNFSIVSRDDKNGKWIIAAESDVTPRTYYFYDTRTEELSLLFERQPELASFKLAPMTPIAFKARDGVLIHGYLTLPTAFKKGPHGFPTILDVHGGPEPRDVWGLNPEVQWLASRGYAVLQINFRGSTGYGRNFETLGHKEWGRKMLYDVIDGKRWAVSQGYTDKDKVCVYGWSYGGYASMAAMTMTPGEFQCGVAFSGISDLAQFVEQIPPYWDMWKKELYYKVGNPKTEAQLLSERSPLTYAQNLQNPLFLAHSNTDPRCKKNQSDEMFSALKKLHKPVTYLSLPEGGHGLSSRFFCIMAATEKFLGENLGGAVEPVVDWTDMWDDLIQ